jgi:hypothetical protein
VKQVCIRGRLCSLVFLAALLVVLGLNAMPHQAPAQTTTPAKNRPGPTCVSPAEAAQHPDKDTCVSAHVYDVVELPDGTRFLDICPPDQPDGECRFTVLCPSADRKDVGNLEQMREHDVQIRGVVRATHGRMGIVLSHVRQFSGGPEKFRPNPKLLRDFNGESNKPPIHDPNLAANGRHRNFMDRKDKEPIGSTQ